MRLVRGKREGLSRVDSFVGYLRLLRSLESFFLCCALVMALVWSEGFVCRSVLVVKKNKMKMQSYFVLKNVIFSVRVFFPIAFAAPFVSQRHAMLWFFFLDHWTIDRDHARMGYMYPHQDRNHSPVDEQDALHMVRASSYPTFYTWTPHVGASFYP